ncbi:MAG: CmcI family methyltransferase [Acidobacteriaceae bacterium]|nr:CmcI family methyltransferase [Acidobacteriaceae bacterium]
MNSSYVKRVINFIRPKPKQIPIDVSEILRNQSAADLVARFNDLYYMLGIADRMDWRGVRIIKNPCDLWQVASLIARIKPAVIVETGTAFGGSALFYTDMARLHGISTKVITVDVNPKMLPACAIPEIVSLTGYSTDTAIVDRVKTLIGSQSPVMVVLDSDHSRENVAKELELYSPLVTAGSYLIVEDSNVNGHPSFSGHGPGPFEAAEAFCAGNRQFQCDKECEQHLLTFNPNGYLRRIA